MKCLIIAAGKGSRLRQRGDSKPLVPILGVPLIERVIRSALKAGIDDFCVVTGYNGEKVRCFLDDLARDCRINITHVVNEAWEEGNGLSVLKARGQFNEKFVLLMTDHLFDVEILRKLLQQPLHAGEIILAVDRNLDNRFADIDDVTKVEIKGGKVVNISKDLKEFNGFDTGIFLCSPAIFQSIAQSISKYGDSSLSGGEKCLADEGNFIAVDTDGRFWIDIDDPTAMDKAENHLLDQLKDKPNDGPVSRHLNRPLSVRISRYLTRVAVSPNQISLVSFLFFVLASGLFMLGGYPALAAGGVLAQFASIIDGCDGEVARLKFQESSFGSWFDAVLDRYADAFLLFGLTWHASAGGGYTPALFVGFLAIIGSFMLSYTADKYDALMRDRFEVGRGLRLGRDVRVFLVFLGALVNQPFVTLLLIAVVMNAETIRRIVICRRHE